MDNNANSTNTDAPVTGATAGAEPAPVPPATPPVVGSEPPASPGPIPAPGTMPSSVPNPVSNSVPNPVQNPVPNPVPNPVSNPVPPVPPVSPASPLNPGVPGAPTPVNPIFQPSGINNAAGVGALAATEAIMRPEPAPAPDPIEEELKAPLKPAAPVPGSIGSAVSVPAESGDNNVGAIDFGDGKQVQSVAFNDPATTTAENPGASVSGTKKKTR